MNIVVGIIWLILTVAAYRIMSKIYRSMFNVVYFGFESYFKEKFVMILFSMLIGFIPIYLVERILGIVWYPVAVYKNKENNL